jgi:hypothetical protein
MKFLKKLFKKIKFSYNDKLIEADYEKKIKENNINKLNNERIKKWKN